MTPSFLRLLVFFLFVAAFVAWVEWWAWRSVSRTWGGASWWGSFRWGWWGISVAIWVLFTLNSFLWPQWRQTHPEWLSALAAVFIVVSVPKMVLAAFEGLELLRQAGLWGARQVTGDGAPIGRSAFLSYLGQGAAALTFVGFLHGVTWGKYAYRIERHRLRLPGFPGADRPLRMVQISDAHLGSFHGAPQPVLDALQRIQDLEPDIIVFTGDLVNLLAEEAAPWVPHFAALQAPLGKFSILGNHDYGDYAEMTEADRSANLDRLFQIHEAMGFRLLRNEHVLLGEPGAEWVLAGVENWGVGFRQSGDLAQALAGSGADHRCTVLLSHDPTHWEQQVMGGRAPVELTLSGHTHGMQLGVEIPWLGIKFSPSKLRYRRWGGLYFEEGQTLHVNRGFGVLGFHGRVGMPPEITLLELEPVA
jgi:predicted MPP superfamily phosphohydrolase